MKASIMETDHIIPVGTTTPTHHGSAVSARGEDTPAPRDLHEWYRWVRRDRWRRALTGGSQHEEWCRASWRTKLWWFREDFLGTPLNHCMRGRHATHKYGDVVARQYGISPARQVLEQVWLRLRYGVSPDAYYMYRLFLPRLRRQAGTFIYIYWKKMNALHLWLNCRVCPEEVKVLKDKVQFYARCKAHDVPTAPVLASFKGGEITPQVWTGQDAPLPRRDLFSKNASLGKGKEATRWRYVGNGCYESEETVLDQNGLIEVLEKYSSELPLLLQECCTNHECISGLSSGGLSTIRLVTGRLPDGPPEPLFASFRMPTGGAVVDNFSAGGIAAPVDLETGRLGSALPKYPHAGPQRQVYHPDTGHPIEGFQMPRWKEIVELCLRAHEAFPGMPSIGWDVAFAERGLTILEGNTKWDSYAIEIPHELPLTHTLFQKHYDAWMQHCLEAETSP